MIRAAVSSDTRTLPPFSTLLAVWKLTPALAATSLIETYRRRIPSCLIMIWLNERSPETVEPDRSRVKTQIRARPRRVRHRPVALVCTITAVQDHLERPGSPHPATRIGRPGPGESVRRKQQNVVTSRQSGV